MSSTFKPPALKIPTLSEHKNEFKKWRQEIRAYLNLYDQCDKILMEEEHEPAPKSPEDYLDAAEYLIENYNSVKMADNLVHGKALDTFSNEARFISTVLIRSCMENKAHSSHQVVVILAGGGQAHLFSRRRAAEEEGGRAEDVRNETTPPKKVMLWIINVNTKCLHSVAVVTCLCVSIEVHFMVTSVTTSLRS